MFDFFREVRQTRRSVDAPTFEVERKRIVTRFELHSRVRSDRGTVMSIVEEVTLSSTGQSEGSR